MRKITMPIHWLAAVQKALETLQLRGYHYEERDLEISDNTFTLEAYLTDHEILQLGVYIGTELAKEDSTNEK